MSDRIMSRKDSEVAEAVYVRPSDDGKNMLLVSLVDREGLIVSAIALDALQSVELAQQMIRWVESGDVTAGLPERLVN